MRVAATLTMALLVGCPSGRAPDRTDAAATTTGASSAEVCVDRWLAGRGLDAFGSPQPCPTTHAIHAGTSAQQRNPCW